MFYHPFFVLLLIGGLWAFSYQCNKIFDFNKLVYLPLYSEWCMLSSMIKIAAQAQNQFSVSHQQPHLSTYADSDIIECNCSWNYGVIEPLNGAPVVWSIHFLFLIPLWYLWIHQGTKVLRIALTLVRLPINWIQLSAHGKRLSLTLAFWVTLGHLNDIISQETYRTNTSQHFIPANYLLAFNYFPLTTLEKNDFGLNAACVINLAD